MLDMLGEIVSSSAAGQTRDRRSEFVHMFVDGGDWIVVWDKVICDGVVGVAEEQIGIGKSLFDSWWV
jgi:hypothetical protein